MTELHLSRLTGQKIEHVRCEDTQRTHSGLK
jgi:hypothetical protein